jgi:hypothetical protein
VNPVEVVPAPGGTLILRARGSELLILPNHIVELQKLNGGKDFTTYFMKDALINRPARKLFEAWLRKDGSLWKRVYNTVHKEIEVDQEVLDSINEASAKKTEPAAKPAPKKEKKAEEKPKAAKPAAKKEKVAEEKPKAAKPAAKKKATKKAETTKKKTAKKKTTKKAESTTKKKTAKKTTKKATTTKKKTATKKTTKKATPTKKKTAKKKTTKKKTK